eukprot:GEMP01054258.1.p1 GENE.GEMP01054258.1~~GEMP01054258.1.p1  ORF type:complete len:244 (+),score=40.86 GEMP01054258.1:91-822(+)
MDFRHSMLRNHREVGDEPLVAGRDRASSFQAGGMPYPNYVVGSIYAAIQRIACRSRIGDSGKAFTLKEGDIVTVVNTDRESNSVRIEKKVTLETGWCPARIDSVATFRDAEPVSLKAGRTYETLGHISIRDFVSLHSERIARLTAGCRVRLLSTLENQMHIEVISGPMRGVTGWISTTSASGENVVAMLPYFSREPDTWCGHFCGSEKASDAQRHQADGEMMDCGWRKVCCSDEVVPRSNIQR